MESSTSKAAPPLSMTIHDPVLIIANMSGRESLYCAMSDLFPSYGRMKNGILDR